MKVVFVGPSLFGQACDFAGLLKRPPARQGDIARAVVEGANAIGLIDGMFETVASVWHKEILYAVSEGVRVFGASSMGALRSAECAAFGMVPIGTVAMEFCNGALTDDAAVAQLHGPTELGSFPLTEALVDALATIAQLVELDELSAVEAAELEGTARSLFFKDRTPETMIGAAVSFNQDRSRDILVAYRKNRISLKCRDALELVKRVRECPDERAKPPDWKLQSPGHWRRELEEIRMSCVGQGFAVPAAHV